LRRSFELAHSDETGRREVPPFLVFCRAARGRDAIFKGLAVPGATHLDQASDLVAIWKSEDGKRFQNYRAVFTILNTAVVRRAWIAELQAGQMLGRNCPTAWRRWVETGKPTPLKAERILHTRNAAQQLGTERQRAIAAAVYLYFKEHPTSFEHFAADVVRLMDANVVALDVTRPSRDGGRDGVGAYRIGMANALRDDAFDAQATGLLMKAWAIAHDVIAETQPADRAHEQRPQPLLALDERKRGHVQVIGATLIHRGFQAAEGGHSVRTQGTQLAVDVGGLYR